MPSSADQAKRALVTLISSLARIHNCSVQVTRKSPDTEVSKAYRALSRRVHPDRGGSGEDQKKLNAAHDAWKDALRARKPPGRPRENNARQTPRPGKHTASTPLVDEPETSAFRI